MGDSRLRRTAGASGRNFEVELPMSLGSRPVYVGSRPVCGISGAAPRQPPQRHPEPARAAP
eukprot:2299974-Heterocapsa_arctica.AAC.1